MLEASLGYTMSLGQLELPCESVSPEITQNIKTKGYKNRGQETSSEKKED